MYLALPETDAYVIQCQDTWELFTDIFEFDQFAHNFPRLPVFIRAHSSRFSLKLQNFYAR
jgi:hypothetical protein